MLGTILLIVVIVWAIKELAEGTGIADRVKYGKSERKNEEN